ncbi:MAG: GNAT family N-acetyltransferase [Clostridia bacterium]|nr:GNAT family N-acetyltransferase [Clostridia bacterium]MDR3645889.1 GNAT family N-acetyltransferase [Clostridia bacterium]
MKLRRYDGAQAFIDGTFNVLLEREAQNNLMIANAQRGIGKDISGWFAASVDGEDGGVLLSALAMPPYPMLLYETRSTGGDEAIRMLAKEIAGIGYSIAGVLAQVETSKRFAAEYCAFTDQTVSSAVSMNEMICTEAVAPHGVPGILRLLTVDDLFFAPFWETEFSRECGINVRELAGRFGAARRRVREATQFIWEDQIPVSMAINGRKTPSGAVLNGVYTPPPYRRRGYATACVSSLTQRLLGEGKQFCCLFADAANPVSNGVYNRIGYRNDCVLSEIHFKQIGSPNP